MRTKNAAADTAYFAKLGQTLQELDDSRRRRVMLHIDYLANKAGVPSDAILRGAPFAAHPTMLSDAQKNISAEIAVGAAQPSQPRPAATTIPSPTKIPAPIAEVIAASQRLGGWCSVAKAEMLVQLVLSERPETCVEIGVFGGRSLLPCAAALRYLERGAIYGIETWQPAVATEHVTSAENDAWWQALDYGRIKSEFLRFVVEQSLSQWVRLIEAPSADAAPLFRAIDFLHVDGAHSVFNAAEDVVLYLKRLKSGGIVVMDDVNWSSTAPAYEILKALCEPIATIKDEKTGLDACAVLRKR